MLDDVIREMAIALQQEAEAARQQGATTTNPLRNGRLQDSKRQGYLYLFDIDKPLPTAVGNDFPAEIEIHGTVFPATIAESRDTEILVLLPRTFGLSIAIAYLHTDLTYLLTLLAERLPSILDSSHYSAQASKVLNKTHPTVGRGSAKLSWLVDGEEGNLPNAEQLEAVNRSLGSEVCFVFGPPGTGKTKTIAAIVKELLGDSEGKILIASHTNVAADNALQALLKYHRDPMISDVLLQGLVVRVGTIVVKGANLELFHIDNVTEEAEKRLQNERQHPVIELEEKEHERNRISEALAKWGLLQDLLGRRTANERAQLEHREEARRITQELEVARRTLEQNRLHYEEASRNNFLVNLWKGLSKKKLINERAELQAKGGRLTASLAHTTRRVAVLEEEGKRIDAAIEDVKRQIPSQCDHEAIQRDLNKIETEIAQLRTQIEVLDRQIADLQGNVLQRARVVVSSLTQTYINRGLLPQRFTTVIIDEASTAPIPAVVYASALASKSIVLVGDPKQLPPICISETEEAKRWLGRDIYTVAGVNYAAMSQDARVVFLRTQYRMHKSIYEVVNARFYDNQLKNGRCETDDARYRSLWPGGVSRLVLIDTEKAMPFMGVERRKRSQSRFNLYHVEVVAAILQRWINEEGIGADSIGVISPYRAQVNFLTGRIHEIFKDIRVEVGTVHTFQGREKDCIIFDTVESFGPARNVGLLLNDKTAATAEPGVQFEKVSRLLTVASSRAKEKFLCVANFAHLQKSLPTSSKTRKWVCDIASRATFDATTLVPYYIPRGDPAGQSVPTLFPGARDAGTGRDFQTARDFFSSFHRDLKEAKEKVIIFSAFVFPNAVSREAPYLQNLVRRGVKTLVFTKSVGERFTQQAGVSALHSLLRGIGVRLFPFEGTHHKIAIIDDRILYFGNLNILSWNGEAKELMSRTESSAEIEQLISVLVRENPKLRSILADEGDEDVAQVPGQDEPMDLNDLIEKLRPRKKPAGSSGEEVREYYMKMLRKLRWVIASDKRIPYQAVLYNATIEAILRNPPSSKQALLALSEFHRNPTNITGYEDVLLAIAREAALATRRKSTSG
jgi:hypothetical protein